MTSPRRGARQEHRVAFSNSSLFVSLSQMTGRVRRRERDKCTQQRGGARQARTKHVKTTQHEQERARWLPAYLPTPTAVTSTLSCERHRPPPTTVANKHDAHRASRCPTNQHHADIGALTDLPKASLTKAKKRWVSWLTRQCDPRRHSQTPSTSPPFSAACPSRRGTGAATAGRCRGARTGCPFPPSTPGPPEPSARPDPTRQRQQQQQQQREVTVKGQQHTRQQDIRSLTSAGDRSCASPAVAAVRGENVCTLLEKGKLPAACACTHTRGLGGMTPYYSIRERQGKRRV